MKIGILTFHCAHNHGAVLQCYALQETLKELGHEVEVINYRPKFLTYPYRVLTWWPFGTWRPWAIAHIIFNELILFRLRWTKYHKFENLINRWINQSPIVSREEISPNYDAVVFGSDQIWNDKITKGFDQVYFASMPFEKGAKKYIAYAASAGQTNFNEEQKSYLKRKLKNFDSISVRESSLKAELDSMGIDSTLVSDPTFLLPFEKWKLAANAPKAKRPYVLTYEIAQDPNVQRIATSIASEIGADVIELKGGFTNLTNKYQATSPDEYVGLFMNAACVVTTSFHGTAFSVICQRPFYNVRQGSAVDLRAESLLHSIGLSSRMIDKDSTPNFTEIDFKDAEEKLKHLRELSMSFISKALS